MPKNESEINVINYRHPIYDNMIADWKMAKSFSESGKAVLNPGFKENEQNFTWTIQSTEQGVDEQNRAYEWKVAKYSSFLWQFELEDSKEFENRNKRAEHHPLFKRAVNEAKYALVKEGVTVEKESDVDWLNDLDLKGMTPESLRSDSAKKFFIYGRVHAIGDATKMPSEVSDHIDAAYFSLADAKDFGIRPYVRIISPIDLLDWYITENGVFDWFVLNIDHYKPRMPGNKAEIVQRRLVYSRNDWQVYELSDKEVVLIDSGEHNFGFCPIVSAFAGDVGEMSTESPFVSLLHIDRAAFNRGSELDHQRTNECFSKITYPIDDDTQRSKIPIGPDRLLTYFSQTSTPQILNTDPGIVAENYKQYLSSMALGYQQEGFGRMGTELSKENRSGQTLKNEKEVIHDFLVEIAKVLESYENKVYEMLWKIDGKKNAYKVKYPHDYHNANFHGLVDIALKFDAMGSINTEVKQKLNAPVYEMWFRKRGVNDRELIEDLKNGRLQGSDVSDMSDNSRSMDIKQENE